MACLYVFATFEVIWSFSESFETKLWSNKTNISSNKTNIWSNKTNIWSNKTNIWRNNQNRKNYGSELLNCCSLMFDLRQAKVSSIKGASIKAKGASIDILVLACFTVPSDSCQYQ